MSTARTIDTGTTKLLCDVTDGIATVTFNNPEKRNALSAEIRRALPTLLTTLQDDGDVRVVILTGAGDKAFVSGADISEFAESRTTPEARAQYDVAGAFSGKAWAALEKPIIAMIRGYCIGGGLITAMQADIRIASDDSTFGVPAARLGLGYAFGGVEKLIALVGAANAAEILYSADRFDAARALQMGLVNRVVSVDRLPGEVMSLARSITDNAPLTVRALKASINAASRPADKRDLDRVNELVEACFDSDDYREGQAAFMEKRRPEFKGR